MFLDDFGGSETYTSKNGGETDSFYELDDADNSQNFDLDSILPPVTQRRSSKIVHKCCGTVPHWRPYKPTHKKCCADGTLANLNGSCDNR